MESPDNNSRIEFIKVLEELDRYLNQYDHPQWVFERMKELNKEIDILADKALDEYHQNRKISLKFTQAEHD